VTGCWSPARDSAVLRHLKVESPPGCFRKNLKLPFIFFLSLNIYEGSQAALMEVPKMRHRAKFGDLLDAAGISVTARHSAQNKVAYSHKLLAVGRVL